jgi:gallate dioxygenase
MQERLAGQFLSDLRCLDLRKWWIKMARIVAGVGVPHTPMFPATVRVGDPENETARMYQRVKEQLDEVNFFLDNYPAIGVGVAESTQGPNDNTPGLTPRTLVVNEGLAEHVRVATVLDGFDGSVVQQFTLDHGWMVPLHYLQPRPAVALVPVFVNGLLPPLPSAQRAWDLGRSTGAAVASWPSQLRVAVVASGSFSLDVGGHFIAPKQIFGVPEPRWAERVQDFLLAGEVEDLVHATTRVQMAAAGNVAGEILDWIAMLGAIGGGIPTSLEMQTHFGHGFGFWGVE